MLKKYLESFFSDFSEEMIDKLVNISHIKKCKKDNILFYEGDKPKNLYLIVEGIAIVYKTYEDYSTQVLKYFYPVNLIAELANINNIPYPASCKCEENSTFVVIDYELYKKIFSLNPFSMTQSTQTLLMSIASKLYFHINENNLRPMKNLSIIQRISAQLLQDLDYFNRTKRWKVAQDLCISSETLSRTLNKLKTIDAISIEKGKISIIDSSLIQHIVQNDFDVNYISKPQKRKKSD
ncbi:MAG: Crp/Fnr family transcriptional regulator [Arcobacteraceae bacterium]|jgi:CRP/FNR family transcriptional regulator|nr:Crp/Fnr family transcriptional regulator [Arcobacteraceae bacterium]